jgi:hypothetical protein
MKSKNKICPLFIIESVLFIQRWKLVCFVRETGDANKIERIELCQI